jgi:hypothetical protein
MHLWAHKHLAETQHEISPYSLHLRTEGYKVEKLAKFYIESIILPNYFQGKILFQHTYADRDYLARSDVIIFDDTSNAYHIYEIKSSTSIHPEHLYDVTFQTLVYEAHVPIGSVNIVHLNKNYTRQGEVDLAKLFISEDITQKVMAKREEVLVLREQALKIANSITSNNIPGCLKPNYCPCLDLCHPGIPDYSIHELMCITQNQKKALIDLGVWEIAGIPDNFILNDKQYHQIESVHKNEAVIQTDKIKHELDKLTYPLYFLDYETYNAALPQYDGYHPHQQMVFQYSLYKLEKPDSNLEHFEHLSLNQGDPGLSLVTSLSQNIGSTGSVIVWNKSFEMSRNQEMARLYPEFADILTNINSRVFDLMDIFYQGYYMHPDFHGSWSIKNILPVIVPELTYQDLPIAKGDQAMLAWWELRQMTEDYQQPQKQTITKDLLKYCELDTLAMVEIWRKLRLLTPQPVAA